MICLKHSQQYNDGQYCVYCGSPYVLRSSTTSTMNLKIESKTEYMKRYHEKRGKRKYNKKKKILHPGDGPTYTS